MSAAIILALCIPAALLAGFVAGVLLGSHWTVAGIRRELEDQP